MLVALGSDITGKLWQEDSNDITFLFNVFQQADLIVNVAKNGEEICDIAFMDIDMPVMNGFNVTKVLREWEDIKRLGARQLIYVLMAVYVDDFEREELAVVLVDGLTDILAVVSMNILVVTLMILILIMMLVRSVNIYTINL